MSELGHKFLAATLGQDGAKALRKAVEREPQLAGILIPRTIVGWLNHTTETDYEGQIPGIENSYVQFQKSDDGTFKGAIGLEQGVYPFENSSLYHLAAGIATALGLEPSTVDPQIRDAVLVKLGKSIDTLAKARVLMKSLKSGEALKPTRMTTHGSYHIEKSAEARPYSVVHTATGSPVQAGIPTLSDAQPIADWHQNRYQGVFQPQGRPLDPAAGIQFQSQDQMRPGGVFGTSVEARRGEEVLGRADFEHRGNELVPVGVQVDPQHRRQGIATAMYKHAQAQSRGRKLSMEKVESPGRTHQPTAQEGPQAPTPPSKQPAFSIKKPKIPSMSVGKSEAQRACSMCGGHQFADNKFRGCFCFADLAKSVSTTAYGDGYVLSFKAGVDQAGVRALMRSLRSSDV